MIRRALVSSLASLAMCLGAASCKQTGGGNAGGGAAPGTGQGPVSAAITGRPNRPRPPIPRTAQILRDSDGRIGDGATNLGSGYGQDQGRPADDKTLAPYLYVAGGDPKADLVPLKETSADVNIAGVIARVHVRQLFVNSGGKPIEAVYVFPGSTRAAVHGMRMRIGTRTIEAEIDEKQQARQRYEQAKTEGKRASLLEQERPNVFTMNVANIMPGDQIQVELDYSELLVPEDAVYEFVYPTVVGPRYTGGADPAKDQWMANPTQGEGQQELYKWGIGVHLETGVPIKELSSPSHEITQERRSATSVDVKLAQEGGGNKDFVLRYRLAGDQVETGLLLYPSDDESFFLLMMEPPAKPTDAQIPPREYVFVMDVSGSMWGFPIDTSKALMKDLLAGLRPTDWFNVVLFAGGSEVLRAEGSLPATESNLSAAFSFIDRPGGGGTELLAGLKAAYEIPRPSADVSRTVVVVTDGYVGVEAKAFQYIRQHLDQANLFAFGIGSSVNRALIEGMARAGLGEPQILLGPEKAAEQAKRFREYIQYPVLSGIQVKMTGVEAYDVAPEQVPDLLARRPLVVYGKYKGEPKGAILVTGHTGEGPFRREIAFSKESLSAANAPIRFLWARKWVELLEDQLAVLPNDETLTGAITNLGLGYGLLTPFTSFVAVDSQVVNQGGAADKVRQPLPMPEGVSNNALEASKTVSAAPMAPAPMAPARGAAPAQWQASPGAMGLMGTGAGGGGTSAGAGYGSIGTTGGLRQRAVTRAKGGDKDDAAGAVAGTVVLTVSTKAEGLADPAALAAAVETAIRSAGPGCGLAAGAKLQLTLRVNAAGKIVDVAVKGVDAKIAACLRKALTALTSAARASDAAKPGVLTLALEIR